METFNIDLNEMSSKKPRVKRQLIFGAFICLAFLLSSLSILLSINSPIEWILLMVAVYIALYIYYTYIAFKADLYIKANSSGLEYKFGLIKSSKNSISWDVVMKVRFGPAYIAIYKKSGRRKRISISWLPYAKVLEIKDKLIKLCDSKNIKYEIVDFVKYPDEKNKKKKNKIK